MALNLARSLVPLIGRLANARSRADLACKNIKSVFSEESGNGPGWLVRWLCVRALKTIGG